MNNVKNSIGWADYTWNPVTGCKRSCEYCYARKIHNRFNNDASFSSIQFHPDRLQDPFKIKKPSRIFVGSMSDIEYWSIPMVEKILYVVNKLPQHTFMFLSKNTTSYMEPSLRLGWPQNTMHGLTVEIPNNPVMANSIEKIAIYPRPFLSIEPIAGGLYLPIHQKIELVIVGAETGKRKNKIIPEKDWIHSISDHVPADKIYWKKNIKKYFPEIFQ